MWEVAFFLPHCKAVGTEARARQTLHTLAGTAVFRFLQVAKQTSGESVDAINPIFQNAFVNFPHKKSEEGLSRIEISFNGSSGKKEKTKKLAENP